VSALLLVAHGSADPRAAAMTRALARAVRRRRPGVEVRVAFLDHTGPRPGSALFELSARGHRAVTVVPLLLTAAYHGRIDLPAAIAAAQADGPGIEVVLTDVLGPDPLLLAGLRHRLAQAVTRFDGLVLVAAGTRDPAARSTVDAVADDLAEISGVPARAAFGSASAVTGAVAVEALRAAGCRRVAVASYFLACGKLYDAVTASAIGAGALAPAAQPLGDVPELAELILARATLHQLTVAV
jgi:sirohydrochlorin ferrochelatase